MNLELKHPIAFFDLETTGITVGTDKIIEIAIIKVDTNGNEEKYQQRFNPGIAIPQESIDIHGLTNEMLKDEPAFESKVDEIIAFLDDATLAGFNSNRFDIPMLLEEILRAGKELDMTNRKSIDVQTIYHKKEPRTLAAAYQFYCDQELENAHAAMADTAATFEIFKAQLEKYEDLAQNNVEELADYSAQGNFKIGDFAGRLVRDEKNRLLINFGKYKGQIVQEVLVKDPSYYNWMMNGDFPLFTKALMTQEMDAVKASGKLQKKVPKKEKPVDMNQKLEQLKKKFNA